jgi:integrase/recombinase XerD
MLKAIEAYLALRRATGFAMLNAEYLLKSFAAFATERGQTHVHTQTAIDWAARGPSVVQRDARLKSVCRFVRHVRVEDAGMSCRRSITSAPARRGACRISTQQRRSIT